MAKKNVNKSVLSIDGTADEISVTLSNADDSITWSSKSGNYEWVAKELILENTYPIPNTDIIWYDLASYLPDTVNTYEVMIYASLNLSTISGSNVDALAASDIFFDVFIPIIRASRQAGSAQAIYASTVIIPVIGRIGVRSFNIGGGRVVGLKGYRRIS